VKSIGFVILAVVGLLLAACGGSSSSSTPEAKTLTVFAAASLTDSFNELGKRFETDNPGVTVKFNYGGSSDLAQQIVNGAPADVFAAASAATMKTVTDQGLGDGAAVNFATNELQIAVPSGNPKGIKSLADLANPALKVVVCAPQVPCGAATLAVEKATGVTIKAVSEEADVKSTLAKVTTGNADAALVYVTDVIAANKAKPTVDGISFPQAKQALNQYPTVVIRNAAQAAVGHKFVDLVLSDAGKKILQTAGFVTV
jgi:molybdate transport system substrate-binding protein